MASEEHKTGKPTASSIDHNPPLEQDMDTDVPEPFNLAQWVTDHADTIATGRPIPLFGEDHPDQEFTVDVVGGAVGGAEWGEWARFDNGDTWLYQVKGAARVESKGEVVPLQDGGCCIIPPGQEYRVSREVGTVGLVVAQDPLGNKQQSQEAKL